MTDILIIIIDTNYVVDIEMVPPVAGVIIDENQNLEVETSPKRPNPSNLTNLVSVAY